MRRKNEPTHVGSMGGLAMEAPALGSRRTQSLGMSANARLCGTADVREFRKHDGELSFAATAAGAADPDVLAIGSAT